MPSNAETMARAVQDVLRAGKGYTFHVATLATHYGLEATSVQRWLSTPLFENIAVGSYVWVLRPGSVLSAMNGWDHILGDLCAQFCTPAGVDMLVRYFRTYTAHVPDGKAPMTKSALRKVLLDKVYSVLSAGLKDGVEAAVLLRAVFDVLISGEASRRGRDDIVQREQLRQGETKFHGQHRVGNKRRSSGLEGYGHKGIL